MSKIEWTEKTWNPLAGCKEISPGCTHCYAAKMAKRLEAMEQEKYAGTTRTLSNGKVVWTGKISLLDENDDQFTAPLRRTKPTTYFVNSMSDLFHQDVPFDFIDKVFAVMALCQHHKFQVLTKRPERMVEYFQIIEEGDMQPWFNAASDLLSDEQRTVGSARKLASLNYPLPNVWLGTSIEDQQRADERIPQLLKVSAIVRFLSCEPLLGPVEFSAVNRRSDAVKVLGQPALSGIHWVIAGGESGRQARPMQIEWARSLRDQCMAAGVAFHFKQWGQWCPFTQIPDESLNDVELDRREMLSIGEYSYHKLGKKLSGRQLDGQEWNEVPTCRAK